MKQLTRFPFLCVLLALVLASLFAACGNAASPVLQMNAGSNNSTSTNNSISTNTSTSSVPLKVTRVDMTVSPSSLSNYACGTNMTVTYTATFHFPDQNAGGQIKFEYTNTNGRSSSEASLNVPAGQTTATYHFTWSGQLPADHTEPGRGGVMVTSPNAYTSQLIAPSGACSTSTTTSAPFKVNSVDISTSPSITGHACGSLLVETYTAVFHIEPGGPGGSIVFQYTINNGRSSSQNISLPVTAGQTTATYHFTWSGQLHSDHTEPGRGGVMVTSPNAYTSQLVAPSGVCS
jgi:hypothetical protein